MFELHGSVANLDSAGSTVSQVLPLRRHLSRQSEHVCGQRPRRLNSDTILAGDSLNSPVYVRAQHPAKICVVSGKIVDAGDESSEDALNGQVVEGLIHCGTAPEVKKISSAKRTTLSKPSYSCKYFVFNALHFNEISIFVRVRLEQILQNLACETIISTGHMAPRKNHLKRHHCCRCPHVCTFGRGVRQLRIGVRTCFGCHRSG